MAFVKSNISFTLRDLDLSSLQGFSFDFFNNVFEKFKGKTYEDVVVLTPPFGDGGVNFGGTGFQFNGAQQPTAGRVQAIELQGDNDQTEGYITGLNISAANIGNAIATNSFKDDLKIWKSAFSGNDTMRLSNDNDNMKGFKGNDKMFGRGGDDKLSGNAGNDRLVGGNGEDRLSGGSGRDNLKGGKGDDRLAGGGGADKLDGGGNNDVLIGGGGADRFIFKRERTDETTSNVDVIRDFKIGTDVIDIRPGGNSFDNLVIWEEGGNAVVAYSHGNIILNGVSQNQVTADMFDF